MKAKPALIAQPAFVHVDITPAYGPVNLSVGRRVPRNTAPHCTRRVVNTIIAACAAPATHRGRSLEKPHTHFESKIRTGQSADRTNIDDIPRVSIIERAIFKNSDFGMMTATEDLDLIRLRHVFREPDAPRAQNAAFLIEFHQRPQRKSLKPSGLLAERKTAVVSGVRHVVILKPALARLVTNRTVNGVMQQQEFHSVANRSVNPLGIRADFHAFRNGRRTRRHQLGSAFHLDEAHPAASFDSNIGVVTVPRNLDAYFIRDLNDCLTFFRFVRLSVDRELGHNRLD
jgi:hypothetical protein